MGCPETMCPGTNFPGPKNESSLEHTVPAMIHPSQYALYNTYRLMHSDRDVSMQAVSGTNHSIPGVLKIQTGTHRFRTSHRSCAANTNFAFGVENGASKPLHYLLSNWSGRQMLGDFKGTVE